MYFTLDIREKNEDSCINAWNYLHKFGDDYEFDDTTPTPMNPIRIDSESYSKLAYDMCNSYVGRHCPKKGGRRRSKIQQRRSGSKQQRRSRQGKQRNLQGGNLQQRRQRLQTEEQQQEQQQQQQQEQQQQQQQQGGFLSKIFSGIALIGNMLKNVASKQSPTPARSSSRGASPLPAAAVNPAPSSSASDSSSCCAPKCAVDRNEKYMGCGSCSGPDYDLCKPLRTSRNSCGRALVLKEKVEVCPK